MNGLCGAFDDWSLSFFDGWSNLLSDDWSSFGDGNTWCCRLAAYSFLPAVVGSCVSLETLVCALANFSGAGSVRVSCRSHAWGALGMRTVRCKLQRGKLRGRWHN